ncbi:hypothetical protein A1Q2_04568 [Trichosporon asahii var. asahii CBS 8904]|uniref:Uncharacterized protein n=1 Tax=Trichosporon asahii var. asahii (strain CBS 8904) TaxID=1220162 RepID=K1VAL7_TRIAC|nr:hypothetical protein A1Q2_04568 [Trichosporon asahii var. asahii CBS 8904]
MSLNIAPTRDYEKWELCSTRPGHCTHCTNTSPISSCIRAETVGQEPKANFPTLVSIARDVGSGAASTRADSPIRCPPREESLDPTDSASKQASKQARDREARASAPPRLAERMASPSGSREARDTCDVDLSHVSSSFTGASGATAATGATNDRPPPPPPPSPLSPASKPSEPFTLYEGYSPSLYWEERNRKGETGPWAAVRKARQQEGDPGASRGREGARPRAQA